MRTLLEADMFEHTLYVSGVAVAAWLVTGWSLNHFWREAITSSRRLWIEPLINAAVPIVVAIAFWRVMGW